VTWVSFVEYWIMREMGTPDAIVRNYALEHPWRPGDKKQTNVFFALNRLGIRVKLGSESIGVDEVAARLRSYGIDPHTSYVAERLGEYYIWDRLKRGDLRHWPGRK
jgi:hypothetical protein